MKAGRELDALVAEHVIGDKYQWTGHNCDNRDCEYKTKSTMRDGDKDYVYRCMICGIKDGELHCPAYSTDIAAAWEVVEKLDLLDSNSSLFKDHGKWYIVGYCESWEFESDTAPMTICLASLKAVGYTKDKEVVCRQTMPKSKP